MKFYTIKNSSGSFTPAYNSDHEKAKKLPIGEILEHTVTRPRNPGFHRKYFAMINCIHHCLNENQMISYPQVENLREAVLIMTGHYTITALPDGTNHKKAKSISFASMDDIEFERVYSDTLDTALQHFLHGLTQEDFEVEIINFM